jgi:hypothetical protein
MTTTAYGDLSACRLHALSIEWRSEKAADAWRMAIFGYI